VAEHVVKIAGDAFPFGDFCEAFDVVMCCA